MKKQILFTLLMLAMGSATFQLFAQDISKKGNYDLAKGVKCRVIPTDGGMQLSFNYNKIEYNVKSPRDAASGQATGKRQHKPYNYYIDLSNKTISEITSPKDVATGQSSGKVSYSDLSVMISSKRAASKPAKQNLEVVDGEFELPGGLADGDYDVVMSWSLGASHPGQHATATFNVSMEDGVARSINESGVSVSTKKKK